MEEINFDVAHLSLVATVFFSLVCFIYKTCRIELSKGIILALFFKFSVAWIYFVFFSSYIFKFNIADAISYFNKAYAIKEVWLSGGASEGQVWGIIAESHFFYYLLSAGTILIFGGHIYAPIFLNIFVSCMSAILIKKISKLIQNDKDEKYHTMLMIFFLMHWEVVSWSSFVNLREMTSVFTVLLIIYSILRIMKNISTWNYLVFLIGIFLASTTRFYISILIMASFITYISAMFYIQREYVYRHAKSSVIILLSFCTSFYISGYDFNGMYKYLNNNYFIHVMPYSDTGIHVMLKDSKDDVITKENGELRSYNNRSVFYNFIRFNLTPGPKSISKEYAFLTVSSWLHLFTYPFFVLGLFYLRSIKKEALLLVIFYFVYSLFFSIVPDLIGPRQRQPLELVFVLCQYYAMYNFWYVIKDKFTNLRLFMMRTTQS